jgi:flagellar basal-body rod modification protein FlgD
MASPVSALTGSSSSSSSSAAATAAAASSGDSQQVFLQLLVSQLQNQDPLNPTDSTQFVTELAQFSELEQTIAIRTDIETYHADAAAAPTTTTDQTPANGQTNTDNQTPATGQTQS